MDYLEYDRIQADLGTIADSFRLDYEKILSTANIDPEIKGLVTKICKSVESHFNETAIIISRTAQLMGK